MYTGCAETGEFHNFKAGSIYTQTEHCKMLYSVTQYTKFTLKISHSFPVTRVTVTRCYVRTKRTAFDGPIFTKTQKCSTALCADIVCRIHVQSRDRVLFTLPPPP